MQASTPEFAAVLDGWLELGASACTGGMLLVASLKLASQLLCDFQAPARLPPCGLLLHAHSVSLFLPVQAQPPSGGGALASCAPQTAA